MLTLEYAPGIKVTDVAAISAAGLDAAAIARRATESYLLQILQHGFFHAGGQGARGAGGQGQGQGQAQGAG